MENTNATFPTPPTGEGRTLGGSLTTHMEDEECTEIFTQTLSTCAVAMADQTPIEEGRLGPGETDCWTSLGCSGPGATRGWTMRGAHGGHIAPTRNLETPLLITTCHNLRPLTFPMTDPLGLAFHLVCTPCTVHVHCMYSMHHHNLAYTYMYMGKCVWHTSIQDSEKEK